VLSEGCGSNGKVKVVDEMGKFKSE